MAAVLTLSIFIVLFVVGLAVLLLLKRGSLSLGEALISPAFGITAFVVPTLSLSQIGLPVERFALIEILVLACSAIAVIYARRQAVPWKLLLVFVPLIAVAFALIAWPQFIFGFNWVSFSNDDMVNYSLAADRLVSHGFYQLPQMRPDEIFRGFNASYWFLYVVNGERTGVEMLLAAVASVTHLRGFQAFMPSIIAFDLTLLCTAAALGWAFRKRVGDALLVGALVAVSPLTAFGSFYQLFAQVVGLPLLTAQTALLAFVSPQLPPESRDRIRFGLMIGMLIAAQALIYPELLPFAGLMYAAWISLLLLRGSTTVRNLGLPIVSALVGFVILTPWYGPRMISLLADRILSQVPHGHGLVQTEFVFPYFLVPSGLSSLWGFTTLTVFAGAWLSVGIALGLLLTLCTAVYSAYLAIRKADPTAIILSVMFALGVAMFIEKVDFGLFKLGMYIQPFLLAVFVAILTRFLDGRNFVRHFAMGATVSLLLFAGAFNQWSYAETSFNGPYGASSGYVEVRDASTLHLLNTLSDSEHREAKPEAYFSDTDNLVLAKYETGYVGRRPLFMLAYNFRENLIGISEPAIPLFRPYYRIRDEYARHLLLKASALIRSYRFEFRTPSVAFFNLPHLSGRYHHSLLFHTGGADTVLNRSNRQFNNGIVYLTKLSSLQNDLTFVQSSLGFAPGPGSPMPKISLFQVEPDYFRSDETMSGIGRYLLFSILNPTKGTRMLLSITDTLAADGKNNLPPASVMGRDRVFFPLVGSGSARVVSPPISPIKIGGYDMLGLDMGEPGRHFRIPRTWLMKLYGQNIQIDPRLLTAFARNISIISESEFRSMKAPEFINNLVRSLTNHNLLYSGIYEDGWISQKAFLRLSSRIKNESFIVNGFVPFIKNPDFQENVVFTIDGRVVLKTTLHVGYFHLKVATRTSAGNHRIEFSFSSTERLPGGDGRPISARITSVGFKNEH